MKKYLGYIGLMVIGGMVALQSVHAMETSDRASDVHDVEIQFMMLYKESGTLSVEICYDGYADVAYPLSSAQLIVSDTHPSKMTPDTVSVSLDMDDAPVLQHGQCTRVEGNVSSFLDKRAGDTVALTLVKDGYDMRDRNGLGQVDVDRQYNVLERTIQWAWEPLHYRSLGNVFREEPPKVNDKVNYPVLFANCTLQSPVWPTKDRSSATCGMYDDVVKGTIGDRLISLIKKEGWYSVDSITTLQQRLHTIYEEASRKGDRELIFVLEYFDYLLAVEKYTILHPAIMRKNA